jgi:hypothetical protein
VRAQSGNRDPAAYARALKITEDAARRGVALERGGPSRLFGRLIEDAVRDCLAQPTVEAVTTVTALLELRQRLGLEVDLDRAQELLYEALEAGRAPRPLFGKLMRAIGISQRAQDASPMPVGVYPGAPAAAPEMY